MLFIKVAAAVAALAAAVAGAQTAAVDRAVAVAANGEYARRELLWGGEPSTGDTEWVCSLQYADIHRCHGALVEKRWVLTPSECLDAYGMPTKVMCGKVDLRNADSEEQEVRNVRRSPGGHFHLLELEGDVKGTPLVLLGASQLLKYVALFRPGALASVTGWTRPVDEDLKYEEYRDSRTKRVALSPCLTNAGSSLCVDMEDAANTELEPEACSPLLGMPLYFEESGNSYLQGLLREGRGCGIGMLQATFSPIRLELGWISEIVGLDIQINPTVSPTAMPTSSPSSAPSQGPTESPSTLTPTGAPIGSPTASPVATTAPSASPSAGSNSTNNGLDDGLDDEKDNNISADEASADEPSLGGSVLVGVSLVGLCLMGFTGVIVYKRTKASKLLDESGGMPFMDRYEGRGAGQPGPASAPGGGHLSVLGITDASRSSMREFFSKFSKPASAQGAAFPLTPAAAKGVDTDQLDAMRTNLDKIVTASEP